MIDYDYCQGKSFQECFQRLKHCFGDQFPSKATVFRWFRQFMFGASVYVYSKIFVIQYVVNEPKFGN